MNGYQLISRSNRKARKQHDCIWCREKIEPGDTYVHEISTYDGLQNHHWHPECESACVRFMKQEHEYEFEPHACKRGSCEEI
jgi:hypothetical protein